MSDEELIAELRDAADWHAGRHVAHLATQAADRLEALTQPSGKVLRKAAENASMYLRTGFIECDRCGHEVPTADTDAEYELNAALEAAQLPARPVVKPDTNALVIAAREIAYDFAVQDAMGKERSDALDKALEPFAALIGWEDEPSDLDLTSEGEAAARLRIKEVAKGSTLVDDLSDDEFDRDRSDENPNVGTPQPAQPHLEVVGYLNWVRPNERTPVVEFSVAQAHIAALTAEVERWQQHNRDTFDAMCAMRNAINEHIPMPSLESDLLQGPENSVFFAAIAEAVVAKVEELTRDLKEADVYVSQSSTAKLETANRHLLDRVAQLEEALSETAEARVARVKNEIENEPLGAMISVERIRLALHPEKEGE